MRGGGQEEREAEREWPELKFQLELSHLVNCLDPILPKITHFNARRSVKNTLETLRTTLDFLRNISRILGEARWA